MNEQDGFVIKTRPASAQSSAKGATLTDVLAAGTRFNFFGGIFEVKRSHETKVDQYWCTDTEIDPECNEGNYLVSGEWVRRNLAANVKVRG